MTGPEFENGGVLRYRVDTNAKKVERLEDWRRDVDKDLTDIRGRLRELDDDLKTANTKLDAVQRTLTRLLITIALSGIGVSFSVLAGTGKI